MPIPMLRRGRSHDRHGLRRRGAQHHLVLQGSASDAAILGYDAQEDPELRQERARQTRHGERGPSGRR